MDSTLPQSVSSNQQFQFSAWHTLKRFIPRLLTTILVDIVIPLALFFALQNVIKPVYALIIAGAPPFLMVIIKAIRFRTFDALGFIVCIGFVMSAVVGITTQDPILLLLGQSFITGVMCLIYTVTLIPFDRCCSGLKIRPLIFYFYQDLAPTKHEQLGLPENIFQNEQDSQSLLSDKQEVVRVYRWLYSNLPSFRRSCYLITTMWSIGLFFGFFGQLILILLHLSVNIIVIYGHVILTSIIIICIILTIIFVAKERKETMKQIDLWKNEHLNMQ